jgi:hypothetical protein
MAQLRLIVALALVAACRQTAEAAPATTLAVPATWHALPRLVDAFAATSLDHVEAWGEPAMGCYAVSLALLGEGAAPDVVGQQALDAIAAEPGLAGIAVSDVVKPAAGADRGTLAFAFARGAYRGRVRAALAADGQATAVACYWNDREPAACEAACTQLLGSAK